MANAFYAKGKEKILKAQVNFDTDTIRAVLVRNTYTENLATDEFFSTISTHAFGTPVTLTSKTTTNGVFDAADVTFPAVTAGSTYKGVVIYKDTGNTATSPLLAFLDDVTGFPAASNNGDIVVVWDNGANKIFSL